MVLFYLASSFVRALFIVTILNETSYIPLNKEESVGVRDAMAKVREYVSACAYATFPPDFGAAKFESAMKGHVHVFFAFQGRILHVKSS